MSIGIDSMILVYAGIVPRSTTNPGDTPEAQKLARRAKILLHNLRSDTVVLPTIALSELLVPVAPTKRGLLIAALSELFVLPEFGELAAVIAADIWARYKDIPPDLKYENRHVMRADAKIIASAKAIGATHFYTNDDNCRALADLVMKGCELPKIPGDLFFDEMLEEGGAELPKKRARPRGAKGKRKPKK